MNLRNHHCTLHDHGFDIIVPKKPAKCSTSRYLAKMCLVSEHHPKTYTYFRSYPAIMAERQTQVFEGTLSLIHPFSLLRSSMPSLLISLVVKASNPSISSLIWSSIMTWVNLAHMFMSTFRLCFILDPLPFQPRLHVTDYVLLVLHIFCQVDIILNFYTGYYSDSEHIIVMNKSQIARRYLRRWFIFDVVSCLPVAFILLYLRLNYPRIILMAHIQATTRLFRIRVTLGSFKTFAKVFVKSYICQDLLRYAVLLAITLHCGACVLYICPVTSYYWYGEVPSIYVNFLYITTGTLAHVPLMTRYKLGIYLCLLACIGSNFYLFVIRGSDEIAVFLFIALYASLFMIYSSVFMFKTYLTMYDSSLRYYGLMSEIEAYMCQQQFPASLKSRVTAVYHYTYHETYFKEDNNALNQLSEQLRNEISLHTCHKLVNSVGLFKGVPASVVGTVLGCLHPEVYLPHDLVMRAGETGDCMYFIAKGTVAVYSVKGVEVCHLEDGAHFGEVALLMRDSMRMASVIAVEITQVYRLDKSDFRNYVISQPVLYGRIEVLASQRMHETVLLDEKYRRDKEQQEHQNPLAQAPGIFGGRTPPRASRWGPAGARVLLQLQ